MTTKSISKLNYRAYYPGYQKMYNVEAINLKGKFVIINTPQDMEYSYEEALVLPYNEISIMQSHGVLSKDGVLAFDKDVIEFTIKGESKPTRHILENNESLFEDGIFTKGKLTLFEDGFIIVGNVYENNNLMNVPCKWLTE